VFTIPLTQGNPETALADPYAAVVTPEVAERLFGDANPIGQPIEIGYDTTYTVRGVLAPIPTNLTPPFDVAVPIQRAGPARGRRPHRRHADDPRGPYRPGPGASQRVDCRLPIP